MYLMMMVVMMVLADDDVIVDDVDDYNCDDGNYCTFPLMTWMLFMKPA